MKSVARHRSFIAAALLGTVLHAHAQEPVQDQPAPPAIAPAGSSFIAQTDVGVSMRDGTLIRVDVWRPARAGRHPTLYLAGPFPHDDATPPDGPLTGPLRWYVERGYAVVLASVRGSGGSSGDYGLLSRDEQQDHYELIEWIAAQSWSNQRVAGAGAGYYATSQWLASLQRPPHLSCIAPYSGTPDPYRDLAFVGGIANEDFATWYEHEVREANAFAGEPVLIPYDPRFEQLAHPLRDDYWRLRSSLDAASQVDVPVLLTGAWGAPGTDSSLRLFEQLDSPARLLLVDDGGDLYADPDFHAREILPFYEWCLKGGDDHFTGLPRIRYQPVGQEYFHSGSDWPPVDAEFATLRLTPAVGGNTNTAGTLDFSTGQQFVAPTSSELDDTLRFVSSELQRPVQIAGPLMLELYVESTGSDAGIEVHVLEERMQVDFGTLTTTLPSFLDTGVTTNAPATTTSLHELSRGRLRASLRAAEEARSSDYRPFHSFVTPQPLQPGRVQRLDIALDSIAWQLQPGSRLVIEVRSVSDGALARHAGALRLRHDALSPSRLWLPVVDDGVGPLFAEPSEPASVPTTEVPGAPESVPTATSLFNSDDPVIYIRDGAEF